MKKVLLILVLGALVAGPALAALGDVVASFAPPVSGAARGIACSGNYLYIYCYSSPYNIYTCSTAGSVISSYVSPFGSSTYGLGYQYGGYLWVGRTSGYIGYMQATAGSLISSFRVTEHTLYGGIACEGNPTSSPTLTSIISNDYSPYVGSRHTTAGSLLNSFTYSSSLGNWREPAWDYLRSCIWWTNSSNNQIYQVDTTGSVLSSFTGPATYHYGNEYYEDYLWIGAGASPYYIYKVHCPHTVSIAPSSLGRVKAIFK